VTEGQAKRNTSLFSCCKYPTLIILPLLSCKIFEHAHFYEHTFFFFFYTVHRVFLKAQRYYAVNFKRDLRHYCNNINIQHLSNRMLQ